MNSLLERPLWLFALVFSILGGVAVGLNVGKQADFQLLLLTAIGIALVVILTRDRSNVLLTGYWIWILLFFIGYRTLQIENFRLHPLTILIFVLGVVLAFSQEGNQQAGRKPPNLILAAAILLWVLGWIQGALRNRSWDLMLGEALHFAALLPIYSVSKHVLKTESQWRTAVGLFYIVASAIAVFGIIEYTVPDLGLSLLPGFIMGEQTFIAGAEGFLRSSFAFYGSPAAVFLCLLALPMMFSLMRWESSKLVKISILFAFVAQLVAIYISGYRSIWILSALALFVTVIGQRNLLVIVAAAIVIALIIQFLPETGAERLNTIMRIFENAGAVDHSTELRYERAMNAIMVGLQEPLGVGWGGTGWVHSDFAQLAGNFGIGVGIASVFAYLWLVLRTWRVRISCPGDPVITGLIGSLVGAGGLLALQGVQVLTQLIFPVWFILVLALIRPTTMNHLPADKLVNAGRTK